MSTVINPVDLARKWAPDVCRRYFGYPIYLVGSCVKDETDPRDIDLVICLPAQVFEAMYSGRWDLWAKDCAKQSLEWTLQCKRAIDFKTQTQSLFNSFTEPRKIFYRGWVSSET